jgi:hypothetical protein
VYYIRDPGGELLAHDGTTQVEMDMFSFFKLKGLVCGNDSFKLFIL